MFREILTAIVNMALIGIGLYTMFTEPNDSNRYIVGLLMVMWGTLGNKGVDDEK